MSIGLKVFAPFLVGLMTCTGVAAQTPPTAPKPATVTRPDWLKRPSAQDLLAAYPPVNGQNTNGGTGVIGCLVTVQGALERCKVVEEKPVGSGFGQSALLLAPSFRMVPMKVNGQPVGGAEVKIPVNFAAIGNGGLSAGRIQVLTAPPWRSTPTLAQVEAAYPQGSAEALDRGHVGMRCKLRADGHLSDCDMIDGAAKGRGFEAAARKLLPLFQVAIDEKDGKLPGNLYVSLAIDLPNPKKPQPPHQILEKNWMALPEPEFVRSTFPEKAKQAQLTSGLAVLDCKADHQGYVVDCKVVKETPEGMDFGQAAIVLAAKMRLSPWTTSGSPTDGASVRLPLKMAVEPESPPGPAASAADK